LKKLNAIIKMNIFFNNIFWVIGIVLVFTSCNKTTSHSKDIVIAETAGKKLYKTDIIHNPIGYTSQADSINFVNDYINNWIKNQLLVSEAEKILSNEKNNIEKELEKYRQELLIHKYRNKRIENYSVNEISNNEIKEFYNTNIKLFNLDRSIVRVTYIVFPIELELPDKFKTRIRSTDSEEINDTENFIYSFATKYDHFNNNWLYFETFLQSISYSVENHESFLQKNALIEFTTDYSYHLIVINDFELRGNTAPFEFVSPRIRSMIINNKKLDFLREIKDSLYNNALKYNKFRVFN
jgi:hypothetical protein